MHVACLTATYGRFAFLRKSLAYFLAQMYPDKSLWILNNHPKPIECHAPGVHVLNMPGHPDLGSCRHTLLRWAEGDAFCTWDDDDRFYPWHVEQAVEGLCRTKAPAWKPKRSWLIAASGPQIGYRLSDASPYIASAIIRADFLKELDYLRSSGDEDVRLIEALSFGPQKWAVEEVGWKSSYGYYWNGIQHASAILQSKLPLAERDRIWKERNADDGGGQPLTPDFEGARATFAELVAHCDDAPQASWSAAPWACPHPFLTPEGRASLAAALKPYIEANHE